MKKLLILMSALLLVVLLVSCSSSDETIDVVYDMKITVSDGVGNYAGANGTYYFNGTEATKAVMIKSANYCLYSDMACTECSDYELVLKPNDETSITVVLDNQSGSNLKGNFSDIVKSVSTQNITLKPGTETVTKEVYKITIDVFNEVSFDILTL